MPRAGEADGKQHGGSDAVLEERERGAIMKNMARGLVHGQPRSSAVRIS